MQSNESAYKNNDSYVAFSNYFSFEGPLANLAMFTKARLSVQPISDEEWTFILGLEEE